MQGNVPTPPVAPRIAIPSAGAVFGAIRNRATDETWRQLRPRVLEATCRESMLTTISSYLENHTDAVLTAWYFPAATAQGTPERIESLMCPMDGLDTALRQDLKSTAEAAIQSQQMMSRASARPGFRILAAPLPQSEGQCILAITETHRSGSEAISQISLILSAVHEWQAVHELRRSQQEVMAVAAIAEVVAAVQQADDVDAACSRMAEELSRCFGNVRTCVGLQPTGGHDCRLKAISGQKHVDSFSEQTRFLESVFLESLTRRSASVWPPLDDQNRHSLLAHRQLAEHDECDAIVSVPLLRDDGQRVGCIVVMFGRPEADMAEDETDSESTPAASAVEAMSPLDVERFVRAGSGSLIGCLCVLQKLADSRWLNVRATIRRWMTRKRKQAILTTVFLLCAAMCVPVQYKVSCEAELQPVERRFVAAPFDASLEECFVEPGDTVEADQLMARLDGREIRWELAGVQADLNRANKQRNTHISHREFGEAEIALYEIERLQSRADLLADRSDHLELRSPVAGIVVSGDHREAEGVPLKMGDSLFEIAPLDRMIIEVSVPEEDIRHVVEGQTVFVQLDAMPESPVEARIARVHPKAELRENENIFVAEAEIENTDGVMRPGMKGDAKISTRRRPLGWNLFHKPVAYLMGRMGW
ncbi:MAG: HlyD family efflux transporter periplasmic adaptor subunit [Planctomycetaceae bacterium]|nr:HlyD family efflux transporter periplasmic adaptor subunit [Planctomycetaceae bacterium]